MAEKALLQLVNPVGEDETREFKIAPHTISEDISIDYDDITAPGIAHPYLQFVKGNSMGVRFDIELSDRASQTSRGYTEDFIDFLYRFLPDNEGETTEDYFIPPPMAKMAYGDNLYVGVITDLTVKRKQFHPDTLATTRAVVEVTMATVRRG